MTEVIVVIVGALIIVAAAVTIIVTLDRKIRYKDRIRIVCDVCRKTHWVPKTQLAAWAITGMRGDGRCDCGSLLKAAYLAHPYVQGVISRAYSQLYRNDAADETIKTIQENLERSNRARIPEVIQ